MTLQTTEMGYFRPVGSQSFGDKRKAPRAFDQQPLEATATIAACLAAWRCDGDFRWRADASVPSMVSRQQRSIDSAGRSGNRSCCDVCTPAEPTRTEAGNRSCPICSGSPKYAASPTLPATPESRGGCGLCRPSPLTFQGITHLSRSTFFNRQALHLRPIPRGSSCVHSTGDRTARPQSHGQNTCKPHRRSAF